MVCVSSGSYQRNGVRRRRQRHLFDLHRQSEAERPLARSPLAAEWASLRHEHIRRNYSSREESGQRSGQQRTEHEGGHRLYGRRLRLQGFRRRQRFRLRLRPGR